PSDIPRRMTPPLPREPPPEPQPAPKEDKRKPSQWPPEGPKDEAVEDYIKDLLHGEYKKRLKAAQELGSLGLRAKSASKALCQAMLDKQIEIRVAATKAIQSTNPELAKRLMLLYERDEQRRLQGIHLIGELGEPEGTPALPVLVWYREKHHSGGAVIEAIATVGKSDPNVPVRFLTWMKCESNPSTRAAIARMIPRPAVTAEQAKSLATLLENETDFTPRKAIIESLGECGPIAKGAE